MHEGEPEWTVRRLSRRKQIHLCLARSKSAPPPRGGASIPRASAPVSTGCLLLYCGPPGCKLLEETTTSLGITGGFRMPVCKVDVTANPLVIYVGDPNVLSEWTSTWWPLRSARKFFRARNTANISRRLMCHERWWSFHRPWLEHPSRIAPQPVREASVVSILRRHEAPNMGPWDRNQGFVHITKARKHHPRDLDHVKGIAHLGKTLWFWATTAGVSCTTVQKVSRSETVWQWVTGLALYFLQPTGWTIYVPVTGMPASTLIPMPRQEKWSSEVEKAHSFVRLAVTPTLSCGQKWHLDAELPTDATELESTNRRYSSFMWIHWRRRGARVASTHFVKVRGNNARPQGRNHGIDIGGSKCEPSPRYFFFKVSRGSDRKNKQARPSTNE